MEGSWEDRKIYKQKIWIFLNKEIGNNYDKNILILGIFLINLEIF